MNRRIGQFYLSYETLREVLHLPEGCEIVMVDRDPSPFHIDRCLVTVTDPSFPELPEGCIPPLRMPVLRMSGDEQVPKVEFEGWL